MNFYKRKEIFEQKVILKISSFYRNNPQVQIKDRFWMNGYKQIEGPSSPSKQFSQALFKKLIQELKD